jgi:hypothetical protein
MATPLSAHHLLEHEARALLARLGRVKPFALHETMVPAARPSTAAQAAIEEYLATGRRELRARIGAYLSWIRGPGRSATAEQVQRRFVFLRLRFNVVLSDFDVFDDVLTQRSEHDAGPWLAGLDVVAADSLGLDGDYFDHPPLICYLDRGHGAAIRRVRARLPGGGESPVAVVRIPRERMIGSGIASSLVHEVGHQAAALLGLNDALHVALQRKQDPAGNAGVAWTLWDRWISEIIADLWSIARIGVGSTLGLMTIVSLPRAFVFHMNPEDPHPMPWIRVRLSCALGAALYPDPQWAALSDLWTRFYPLGDALSGPQRGVIETLEHTMPLFVRFLLEQRPPALRGQSLFDALRSDDRRPDQLRARHKEWGTSFQRIRMAPPSLACAVLGQARADGTITPEHESRLLGDLLTYWGVRRALDTTEFVAARSPGRLGIAAAS